MEGERREAHVTGKHEVHGRSKGRWLRRVLRALLRLLFRVEVRGADNWRRHGGRAVIVANHQSFLDGALLVAFLPEEVTFAVNTQIARRWWVRLALRPVDALPIDPGNPFAAKTMIRAVREGRHVAIFPEGRITVTGSLMKVYDGAGLVADRADAELLPVRIDGAMRTVFSRMRGKMRRRLFPKITLTLMPPVRLEVGPELRGRARRQALGTRMQDLLSDIEFATRDTGRTLFQALLDARATFGTRAAAVVDIDRTPLGYGRLVTASHVLGRKLRDRAAPGEVVGILLPNAVGAAATFFALQRIGCVPAMLNFTMGAETMLAGCRAAAVRTVLTSRRFVERARLGALVAALEPHLRVVYLEDIRASVGLADKLMGIVVARRRRLDTGRSPDDPAVVLFTSGSEGVPKGVVLSHRNLLANCAQIASRVDFSPADKVLNALPLFHSFGLTGGTLLPILSGVQTFLYPSPLHYRIVPELAYQEQATIVFGTDTFLRGYARVAHPYDLRSVRYIFAGAERVQDETRRVYMEKFGVRLLEGYGTTETAPVLAVNTPMHARSGTVGRFLPGIDVRIEPVEGVAEAGRLLVKGPNVMAGYLKTDAPGTLQPPAGGWYDTGDIVALDPDGFVRILGRVKRFAKIAGEMVSLAAVEALASELWPDASHAVLAVPDARKGEQLVLVTTRADAKRPALSAHAREKGMSELMVPRSIRVVERIPVLGSGKTDYPALQRSVGDPKNQETAA